MWTRPRADARPSGLPDGADLTGPAASVELLRHDAVVEHYDQHLGPGLTDAEKSDLVEFLETL